MFTTSPAPDDVSSALRTLAEGAWKDQGHLYLADPTAPLQIEFERWEQTFSFFVHKWVLIKPRD